MVTREDVARKAGVSVGTVSNVMNNKNFVKLPTVEKVKKAISELCYVPDFSAKSLASKRTNHIGIAVFEMTNPYHAEIIQGIEEYAADKGYITSIFLLDNKGQKKLDAICERRLDGLINYMTNELPTAFTNLLKMQKTALVNFNAKNSFIIANEYTDAMNELMHHLMECGHKKVAYLYTQDELRFNADMRGIAFKKGLDTYNFAKDEDLIICNSNYALSSEMIGYNECTELFKKRSDVTAIFATNDLAALGVIRRLSELNLKCPQDVSVIGCDGLALGNFFVPSLTTITFDKRQAGASVASALIKKIENPIMPYNTIVIPSKVLYRESIAKRR